MQVTSLRTLCKGPWIAFLAWALAALAAIGVALYSYKRAQYCKTHWQLLCEQAYELCEQAIAPTPEHAQQANAWLKIQKQEAIKTAQTCAKTGGWDNFLEGLEEQAHIHGVHLARVFENRAYSSVHKQDPISDNQWAALEALAQATLALKPWELVELEYLSQARWKIIYKAPGDFAERWALAIAQLPSLWAIEALSIHIDRDPKSLQPAPPHSGIVLEALVHWMGGEV